MLEDARSEAVLGGIPFPASRRGANAMPTLFKMLVVIGLIGGAVYGAIFAAANFIPLKQRDITVTITPDKFLKH